MNLGEILGLSTITLTGLASLSWIMGGENLFLFSDPTQKISDFTLQEYLRNTSESHSGSLIHTTLAYFTYPSMKYARYLHNRLVKK